MFQMLGILLDAEYKGGRGGNLSEELSSWSPVIFTL